MNINLKKLKKNILGLKKYLIGFMIGLSCIGSLAYAADSGSLGALFEKVGNYWFLKGENIKNLSVGKEKLTTTLKNEIEVNTAKTVPTKMSQLTDDINNLTENDDIKYLKNGYNGSTLKNTYYDVVVDDTLWVKNNLYVDGITYLGGGLSTAYGDIEIDGIPLEKKVKNIDNNWYEVINNKFDFGAGNHRGYTETFKVPSGKVITDIRLSGASDDGGLCEVQVYNKLSLAVTHKAYLKKLNTTQSFDGVARSDGASSMATYIFNISSLSGTYSLGVKDSGNNVGYNVSTGITYLESGDIIKMIQRYNDGYKGPHYNICKMEVKYGKLYY